MGQLADKNYSFNGGKIFSLGHGFSWFKESLKSYLYWIIDSLNLVTFKGTLLFFYLMAYHYYHYYYCKGKWERKERQGKREETKKLFIILGESGW